MKNSRLVPGTVLVLAAGFGRRLGALTQDRPKAMVPLVGVPNLERIFDRLAQFGAQEVIVNTHYKAQSIRCLVQNSRWPFVLRESWEPEIMGTGGALASAARQLIEAMDACGQSAFWVVNCDVVSDFDPCMPAYTTAIAQQLDQGCEGILVLRPDKNARQYGAFEVDGQSRIVAMPGRPGEADRLMFTGIQIVSRRGLERCRKAFGSIFEQLYWPLWDASLPVGSVLHHGSWFDVGTEAGREAAGLWLSSC